MADWPSTFFSPPAGIIASTITPPVGEVAVWQNRASTSAAWPAANRAIYVPVIVETQITIVKMACFTGATAAGNIDLGIYDATYKRLVSKGSTALGGATSTIVVLDITDTTLIPGLYYLAMSCSTATDTFLRGGSQAQMLQGLGVGQQALGSVTLVDPMVPAAPANAYLPAIVAATKTTF